MSNCEIHSPKLTSGRKATSSLGYHFYAGYSPVFVKDVLDRITIQKGATVLDPWNGSGTTTLVAAERGYKAIGFDINPVMFIVAKAKALDRGVANSIPSLARDICKKVKAKDEMVVLGSDPLLTWLVPSSCSTIRKIEHSIQELLVDKSVEVPLARHEVLHKFSTLASFFYLVLFRTARNILKPFRCSNPTWVKEPYSPNARLGPSAEKIYSYFDQVAGEMVNFLRGGNTKGDTKPPKDISLAIASSDNLPLVSNTIDAVISSPPYCTRLDYAMSTRVELAVLGLGGNNKFAGLRDKMIGSPTIRKTIPEVSARWGTLCTEFLSAVGNHTSKASKSYYLKGFLQYFGDIFNSLLEIDRTLKPGSPCVIVVQDSYYKDLHNDLPGIYTEMCENLGWRLQERFDFPTVRNMVKLNRYGKSYSNRNAIAESVLFFAGGYKGAEKHGKGKSGSFITN